MELRVPLSGAGSLALHIDEPGVPTRRSPVVLYLHGFGSSQVGEKADLFRRRFVDRGVAFASFDFQGHGSSDGSMFDLTISRNLEDVAVVHRFLRARGYRHLLLFGSSMGGLTGLWYAVEHSISAAIHLAPALGLEEVFTTRLGPGSLERWERQGSYEIGHDLGSWDIGWGFVQDLRSRRFEALCSAYRTPTLIFQGKHDDSVPWRRVVEFTTTAAGEEVELHLFADGDHRMLDRLPRLWSLTEEFLVARGVLPR